MQREAAMKRAVVVHLGSAPSFRGGDARWCGGDKEHKQTTMARGGVKRKKKKTTSLARGYSPRAAAARGGSDFFSNKTRALPHPKKTKQGAETQHIPYPRKRTRLLRLSLFSFFLILSFPAFHPSSFLFFPSDSIFSHAHAHTLKLRECTRTSSNTNTTPFTHFHQHILSHHV